MDIRKFIINECEDASCKIAVDVREGKKICKYAKSNWTLEEIKKSKTKTYKDANYFNIYLRYTDLCVLDVDEMKFDYNKLPKEIQKCPFVEGNTKGRHYYFKLEEKNNYAEHFGIKRFIDFEGDLLGFNTNVWERDNKIMYNYDGKKDIPFIDFESVIFPILKKKSKKIQIQKAEIVETEEIKKEVVKIEETNVEEVIKCLDQLDENRWIETNLWFAMAEYIKNLTNDEDILQQYSQIDPNYDRDKVHTYCKKLNKQNIKFSLSSLKKLVEFDKKKRENKGKSYEEVKKEFEKTHFKIIFPPSFITEERNGELQIQKIDDFKISFCNIHFINDEGKKKVFVNEWIFDQNIRQYDHLVFDTKSTPENDYNLFQGLWVDNYEQKEKKDISWFHEYMNLLLDKEEKTFLLNWVSWILNNKEKSDMYAILQSDQGSGKDTFTKILSKILRKYYIKEESINHIFDRFSDSRKNKLIIVLDEVDKMQSATNHQQFKSIVTNRKFRYEQKGLNKIDLNDFSNFIIQSNNAAPMILEKGERRGFTIKCKEGLILKKPEWKIAFHKLLEDDDYIYEIYKWIVTNYKEDYSYLKNNFNNFIDHEAVVSGGFIEDKWMVHLYETEPPEKTIKMTSTLLFEEFKKFDSSSKITNAITFGSKMSKFPFVKKSKNGSTFYEFKIADIQKYLKNGQFLENDEQKDEPKDEPKEKQKIKKQKEEKEEIVV